MDTIGPRIMVNVGTQAVSTTGLNPRDLAPLTNDAFLATFLGKTSLTTSNGISRSTNSYRQTYTTQVDRVTLRSKTRPATSNGDSIEPDSAILSVVRGNTSDNQTQSTLQRSSQGGRNRRRSFNQQLIAGYNDIPCSPNYRPANDFNRRRRTRSGGAQQQITVVDQMAAQPHIPYAILPKRFEPKQVSGSNLQQSTRSSNINGGNRRRRRRSTGGAFNAPRRSQRQQDYYDDQWEDDEEDLWLEPLPPMLRRRLNRRPNRPFPPTSGYYGSRLPQRLDNYYNSYSYGPIARPGQGAAFHPRRRMLYQDDGYLPFDIVPSYDLNEWQGPYARSKRSYGPKQTRGELHSGRNDKGFIRDDHRVNSSSRQSRNGKPLTPTHRGKQTKSPKTKRNNSSKRRNSRQRKQRNQDSKTEGTPSTNTNELKLTTENDKTDENKLKKDITLSSTEQPLPPRDEKVKENNDEQKKEYNQN